MLEDNLKNSYSKFILDLVSTIRRAAFYPKKHPVVTSSIKNIFLQLQEILKVKDALNLNISTDNKILAEGEVIVGESTVIAGIRPYLKKWNIEDISFKSGITELELQNFIEIILMEEARAKEVGDIRELLADNNIEHIQLNLFSYMKVRKDEEIIVEKKKEVSFLEDLECKIKNLSQGKIESQQEIENIGKEVFENVVAEFREKKKASGSLKIMLKKFLLHCSDVTSVLLKLKNSLLEAGVAPENVEKFVNKLQESLSKKPREKKKASGIVLEELINENEKLRSELIQLQQKMSEKTARLEAVEKQAKIISDEKEKIDKIIHNMTDGIVVVDPNGKIIMVNPTAEMLLGVTKQDIGKQIKDVIKDEHLLALVKSPTSVKEEAEEKDIELFSPDESTMRVLRASSAVIEDHKGKTVGMVAILNDITRQKELEKLKEDFLARVTHELRTPLVAMGQSISLLRAKETGPLSDNQENFISLADRNLKRLTILINDLLDLSKLRVGKMELVRQPSYLEKVITESISALKAWVQTKSIQLEQKIQEGLPPVNIDPNRIIQVLNNLIGNAIKFTPENGTINVEAYANENREIEVSVKDTGVGMSKTELSKIFDKFYQVKGTLTTDVRGTGIGLTIAKEIIELHGGKIWVESAAGKGTKFIFTLPLQDASLHKV